MPTGGSTCADPPPEIMPTSACAPITAIVLSFDASSGSEIAFIPQEHHALLRDLLRDVKSVLHIDHALPRWIVDHATGEHRAQNAVNMIV